MLRLRTILFVLLTFISDEFKDIARWITGIEVDAHVVDVIFLLLDDDEDQHVRIEELAPILLHWRHSRGFLQVSSKGAGVMD